MKCKIAKSGNLVAPFNANLPIELAEIIAFNCIRKEERIYLYYIQIYECLVDIWGSLNFSAFNNPCPATKL